MKRGRKTKLTKTLQRQLCKIIAMPCTIRSACQSCNIAESTFNDWVRRGEAGEPLFSEFAAAVMRARGIGKVKIAQSILDSDDAPQHISDRQQNATVDRVRAALKRSKILTHTQKAEV